MPWGHLRAGKPRYRLTHDTSTDCQRSPSPPPCSLCLCGEFLNRHRGNDLAHHPEIGRDHLDDPIQNGGEYRQGRVTDVRW